MTHLGVNKKGFTIIELLFSMAVFSVVLLAASAGLIQVGRMYFKASIVSKTQSTARQIIDNITRPIQFSGQQVLFSPITNNAYGATGSQLGAFCIGTERYTYLTDMQVNANVAVDTSPTVRRIRHGLWRDNGGAASCAPVDMRLVNPSAPLPGIELIPSDMRLSNFSINTLGAVDSQTYSVSVWLVYGDQPLMECKDGSGAIVSCVGATALHTLCQGGFVGTQFCAVSELDTVVTRRLR